MAIDARRNLEKVNKAEEILKSLNISEDEKKIVKSALDVARYSVCLRNNLENDGRVIGSLMEDFVNGAFESDKKEFVKYMTTTAHRTLQQIYFNIILSSIKAFAEMEDWQVDGRNQMSHETAKKIQAFLKENNLDFNMPLI